MDEPSLIIEAQIVQIATSLRQLLSRPATRRCRSTVGHYRCTRKSLDRSHLCTSQVTGDPPPRHLRRRSRLIRPGDAAIVRSLEVEVESNTTSSVPSLEEATPCKRQHRNRSAASTSHHCPSKHKRYHLSRRRRALYTSRHGDPFHPRTPEVVCCVQLRPGGPRIPDPRTAPGAAGDTGATSPRARFTTQRRPKGHKPDAVRASPTSFTSSISARAQTGPNTMIATVRNIAARKGCESGLVGKKESRDRERVLVFLTNHSLILNPPVLKCGLNPPVLKCGVEPAGRPPDGDRVWPKGSRCRYVIGTNLNCSKSLGRRSHN